MDDIYKYISLSEAEVYAPASLFLPAWLPEGYELSPKVIFDDDGRRKLEWIYQNRAQEILRYGIIFDVEDCTQYYLMKAMKRFEYAIEEVQVSIHKGFSAVLGGQKRAEGQVDMRLIWFAKGHSLSLMTGDSHLTIAHLLRVANSIAL